jgi:hypothetical protein
MVPEDAAFFDVEDIAQVGPKSLLMRSIYSPFGILGRGVMYLTTVAAQRKRPSAFVSLDSSRMIWELVFQVCHNVKLDSQVPRKDD